MILLELFNNIYSYKEVKEPSSDDNIEYEFWAAQPNKPDDVDEEDWVEDPDEAAHVEVKFLKKLVPGNDDVLWMVMFQRNGDLGITSDAKDSLKIFATVIDIVAAFKKKYKPKVILFTAKSSEMSRVKLYDRLVKKIKGFENISALAKGKGLSDETVEDIQFSKRAFSKDTWYILLNKDVK